MELSALAHVGTMVLAALAIVWRQQRSNDRLRDDLRGEFGALRSIVTENGQRLARIEGYLGIACRQRLRLPRPVPKRPAQRKAPTGRDPHWALQLQRTGTSYDIERVPGTRTLKKASTTMPAIRCVRLRSTKSCR